MSRFLSVSLIGLICLAPGLAAADLMAAGDMNQMPIADLEDRWHVENGLCRGSSDPSIYTSACDARSIYGSALRERGRCYGREDQSGAEYNWHDCGPGSLWD